MEQMFKKEYFVVENLDLKASDFFDWDIVSISTIFKEEFKAEESAQGVIRGYANAVNCLAKSIKAQNHPRGVATLLRNNSLVIPFIFLVRHTVELILKYVREYCGLSKSNQHGLLSLWEDIEQNVLREDSSIKNEMAVIRLFISVLEELDPDGSHARYSKSNKGHLYHNKPKYINVQHINQFLQRGLMPLLDYKAVERKIYALNEKE